MATTAATLARDARLLQQAGYRVMSALPVLIPIVLLLMRRLHTSELQL